MNNKTVFAALLGLTMAGGIGVTAAQAAPVMTDPPYFSLWKMPKWCRSISRSVSRIS